MDVSIHYTLIIQSFTKSLWCGTWITLFILLVFHCGSLWQCGKYAPWETRSYVFPHIVSASDHPIFPFFSKYFLCQNIKQKYITTYNTWSVSTHTSNTQLLLLLRINWFAMCRPPNPDPFSILWLKLWLFPQHEMLDGWIIPSLVVVIHMLRDRSIYITSIWGSPFF